MHLSSSESKSDQQSSPRTILEEKMGKLRLPYSIYAAAKLGVADLLKNGPKRYEELAETLSVHPRALLRVMQILADEGIFEEIEEGRFASNSVSKLLESGNFRERVEVFFEVDVDVSRDILYTVKTGRSAFQHRLGMSFYEYCFRNAAYGQDFYASMAEVTKELAPSLLSAYDFSNFKNIVDVGGNRGALLAEILKVNPQAHGILFDQPPMIEEAKIFLKQEGVLDRCKLIPGSFLDSVPKGGDLYVLKWVLPDWDEDNSIRILRNIHDAMSADSKLLVIDTVMPKGNKPSPARGMDFSMMIIGSVGGIRTEPEIREVISKAGFKVDKVIPVTPLFTVFETSFA